MWITYCLMLVFNVNSIYWKASWPSRRFHWACDCSSSHTRVSSLFQRWCLPRPTPQHWTLSHRPALDSLEIYPRSDPKLFTIPPGWDPVGSPWCVNVPTTDSLPPCLEQNLPRCSLRGQREGKCHLPVSVMREAVMELVATCTQPLPSSSQFSPRCCEFASLQPWSLLDFKVKKISILLKISYKRWGRERLCHIKHTIYFYLKSIRQVCTVFSKPVSSWPRARADPGVVGPEAYTIQWVLFKNTKSGMK